MSKLDPLHVLSADRGTMYLTGVTDYTTHDFAALEVIADTIFTNLEGSSYNRSGTAINELAPTEQNLTTAVTVVLAGTILTSKQDIFSRVKLTSGVVRGIRS